MDVEISKDIFCPHCGTDAIYKYGKTNTGKQRYMCLICKKQFTENSIEKIKSEVICELCGNKMYLYMKDENKGLIRFRCSQYPKCKNYITRRLR
ncbi:MAG: hypothetical protein N2647_02515 [Thermodesulfovibrio sp.]|nr:hypothetical protein [Thermodesulfovibrio sp.]